MRVELAKAHTKIKELTKSTSSLENFMSQARLDVRAVELRAKEAEESWPKRSKSALLKSLPHKLSVSAIMSSNQLSKSFLSLTTWSGTWLTKGFDIIVAVVKKIPPNLELSSIYKAFDTKMEEEEQTPTELATTQADQNEAHQNA